MSSIFERILLVLSYPFRLLAGMLPGSLSPRTKRNLRKELRSSLLAKIGIVIVVTVVLVAVFAPLIALHPPDLGGNERAQLPPAGFSKTVNETRFNKTTMETETVRKTISANASFPLGTDANGRGIYSRLVYGARTSLAVGVIGTVIAALLGVTVGLTAGYYGGKLDDALMRGADVMLAFPSLVLAIALVGLFGRTEILIPDPFVDRLGENVVLPIIPDTVANVLSDIPYVVVPDVDLWIPVPDALVGFGNFAEPIRAAVGLQTGMPAKFVVPGTVIIVVALVNWVWFARVARGEALTVRAEEFVKAAEAIGAKDSRIIRKHVFPNSITPILVLATIQVAAIILLESSLAFLSFSSDLSWGYDIAQGRDYLSSSWWISTIPGIAIVITVVGINLVGDWLRDALDPGIEGEGGGV